MMQHPCLCCSLYDAYEPNSQKTTSQLGGCEKLSGPLLLASLPDGLVVLYRFQKGPICMQVIEALAQQALNTFLRYASYSMWYKLVLWGEACAMGLLPVTL